MISRLFSVLAILCFSLILHAQKPALVVFGGPQATSARYIIKSRDQETHFKYGFMAGAGLKVAFENQLYFFPSVYFSRKGYKVDFNRFAFPPGEEAKNNNTSINTIEIAPLLQFDLSKNASHPFVRFGFSADYAFSGKERFDTRTSGAIIERDMVFSFGDYGRYTASANLHFGYEFQNGLNVFAHTTHGLGSLNNADGGPRIVHRIYGISLGWCPLNNPKGK